ncbi:hypothetical protein FKP32DRAFT_1688169 [Trametes sanguinea]|nr:hypothetical protein FKP32DRAFT_1688169 [Trametes sanguinea]
MWLLTTDRAELKWFARPPGKYAIVSHVWDKDPLPREQSFQEVQQLNFECARSGENPRTFVCEKIRRCCMFAEAHGYKLLWIDTCCINQMSSAELSEAINSIDVGDAEAPGSPNSSFRRSEWFRRGWTLQELIAPSDVMFLSKTWMPIASKRTVAPLLQEITGIDAGVLLGTIPLHKVSVARRLSWSSGRVTTREEDEAYCLMGIFGVHLPTIYGEGREAFIRLQEEIMRRIPDTTLLVDTTNLVHVSNREFAAAFGISQHSVHFTVTSHGIQATCPTIAFSSGCILLLLPCRQRRDNVDLFVALLLRIQSENPPYGIGTRLVSEEPLYQEPVFDEPPETPRPGRPSQPGAASVTAPIRYRQSYSPVRYVLLPAGFDFSVCQQRPLRKAEPSLKPKWRRSYIAYRHQHILRITLPSEIPTSFPPVASVQTSSPCQSHHLYFPSWVLSRIIEQGFALPTGVHLDPLVLSVGQRTRITMNHLDISEEIQLSFGVLQSHAPLPSASRSRASSMLWCRVYPSTKDTLNARMSAMTLETANSSSSSAHPSPGNVPEAADEEDDKANLVDFWSHEGYKGRKEFRAGKWSMSLTFSRLGDRTRVEDPAVCHVYLVDVDLRRDPDGCQMHMYELDWGTLCAIPAGADESNKTSAGLDVEGITGGCACTNPGFSTAERRERSIERRPSALATVEVFEPSDQLARSSVEHTRELACVRAQLFGRMCAFKSIVSMSVQTSDDRSRPQSLADFGCMYLSVKLLAGDLKLGRAVRERPSTRAETFANHVEKSPNKASPPAGICGAFSEHVARRQKDQEHACRSWPLLEPRYCAQLTRVELK